MRRTRDHHLPRGVYHKHGAYWLVRRGKWHRLGADLHGALAAYASLYDIPQGGMGDLIDAAIDAMRPRLARSTIKGYTLAARKLKAALIEFAPDQVKPKHVAALKLAMAKTPNLANRCLSVLRQVFDYALELQIVDTNPAIGIKRHTEARRTRLLSAGEIEAIRAAAGQRTQVIIDLARCTGQRIGDVLAIRRADLTPDGVRFVQQKTGAKLTVGWTPELRSVVERAKSLNGNIRALTLLHNRRGKTPDYRTVRDQWERACRAAGVEDAHLHDLRAVALTAAKAQGLDARALAGHTSAAQTERYLRDKAEPVVSAPTFGRSIDSAAK